MRKSPPCTVTRGENAFSVLTKLKDFLKVQQMYKISKKDDCNDFILHYMNSIRYDSAVKQVPSPKYTNRGLLISHRCFEYLISIWLQVVIAILLSPQLSQRPPYLIKRRQNSVWISLITVVLHVQPISTISVLL